MSHIVSGVLTLVQHIAQLKTDPLFYRPPHCPSCGKAGLWAHGFYFRKPDRLGKLNPVRILRFFCPHCHKTHSVLPECIPPRRWYLWAIQQIVFSSVLAGKSLRAITKEMKPSRHTIRRWVNRFQEQFLFHKDVLCNHLTDLGRTAGFSDFWQACLGCFPLSKTMQLCHAAGAVVP